MQDFLREDIKRPIYSRFILPYPNSHFLPIFPMRGHVWANHIPPFRWLHSPWPSPPYTMMEFSVSSVKADYTLKLWDRAELQDGYCGHGR